MFNQLYIHQSQRWLTTIAWLGNSSVVHVIEKSLGYGISINSNFAQRFADALLVVFRRRFDAVEDRIVDDECRRDPSKAAYMARRRLLGLKLGNRQDRLYSALVYTDDFKFGAVGLSRLVRMMRCWHRLLVDVRLRMAIAAKRCGGTSCPWLGLRMLDSLGLVVIPGDKRARALAKLSAVVRREPTTLADWNSTVGLVQFLEPFAGGRPAMMAHLHGPKRWLKEAESTTIVPMTAQIVAQCALWGNAGKPRCS